MALSYLPYSIYGKCGWEFINIGNFEDRVDKICTNWILLMIKKIYIVRLRGCKKLIKIKVILMDNVDESVSIIVNLSGLWKRVVSMDESYGI